MKHMVLIAGGVYPEPSPTGRVAIEYLQPLLKEYTISIVYMSTSLSDKEPRKWNGFNLYPCCNWRLRWLQWSSINKGVISNVSSLMVRAVGRIQTRFFFPNNLYWFSNSAFNELERLYTNRGIDAVFSVSSPFAAHVAAEKFKKKHPNIKWLAYTVDPYSSKLHLFPYGYDLKKAAEKECECLRTADVCFMSDELIKNRTDLSSTLKTCSLPYMLTFENTVHNTKKRQYFVEGKTILIYAGSFYYKDRNPTHMLDIVSQLKDNNIELHIFSSGDCIDTVKQYSDVKGANIILHDKVSRDTLLKMYDEADVLVNIANQNPESSPSKIFEYIAYRKPIIEFSNNSQSGYLMNYPLALVLSDNTKDSSCKVLEFCKSSQGEKVDVHTLEDIYNRHMKSHIIKLIESYL